MSSHNKHGCARERDAAIPREKKQKITQCEAEKCEQETKKCKTRQIWIKNLYNKIHSREKLLKRGKRKTNKLEEKRIC